MREDQFLWLHIAPLPEFVSPVALGFILGSQEIRGPLNGEKGLLSFFRKKSRFCRLRNVKEESILFTRKGKLAVVKLCFGQLHVSISSQFGNIIETSGILYNVTGAVSRSENC